LPCPGWRAYGSTGYGAKVFVSVISSALNQVILRTLGCFVHLCQQEVVSLIGSGLRYGDDVKINPATEEIAVQFITETQLAVNRAVVETWKALFKR